MNTFLDEIVKITRSFLFHVACFALFLIWIKAELGRPVYTWFQWMVVDLSIAAGWWPFYDLMTRKKVHHEPPSRG